MPRLFAAIEVPDAPKRAIRQALAPWEGDRSVRWQRPDTWHVTLKFLGDTPDDLVPGVIEALRGAAAAHPPLGVELVGFGAFPGTGHPRVLWVGVGGDRAALAALAASVDAALAAHGFPPEDRPYSPHLTVGRARSDARGVVRAIGALPSMGSFLASEVVLFRSDPTPGGTRHTPVATLPLATRRVGAQIPSG